MKVYVNPSRLYGILKRGLFPWEATHHKYWTLGDRAIKLITQVTQYIFADSTRQDHYPFYFPTRGSFYQSKETFWSHSFRIPALFITPSPQDKRDGITDPVLDDIYLWITDG